jgi:transposase
MSATESYVNERLDHLGIVAGVCQEIGLAAWLDEQDPTRRRQVSIGTATTAMILNGLGFSNRQLYLVPQYFANKPVEHLLGAGITAEMLNDDCLGRTLDWLYAHDPTKLFAGIATQARKIFDVSAHHLHVDTTSFAVSGAYQGEDQPEGEASVIAITYGYLRDHREDLKQWMFALATTQEGDVPVFLRALDGNSSDKVTLASAIEALQEQLRVPETEPSFFVADSGVYSEANMRRFNEAKIRWISRVPAHQHRGQGDGGNGSRKHQLAGQRRRADPLVDANPLPATGKRALDHRAYRAGGGASPSDPQATGGESRAHLETKALASF